MVEMDSCQSKVGTFDFLFTEIALDYSLTGFTFPLTMSGNSVKRLIRWPWVCVKAGLWTLDWTHGLDCGLDWTVDWTGLKNGLST